MDSYNRSKEHEPINIDNVKKQNSNQRAVLASINSLPNVPSKVNEDPDDYT